MPNIGPLELIIVLAIVLLIFGPKRLPGLGRQLGRGMREFKDSVTGKDEEPQEREALPPAPPAAPPADPGPACRPGGRAARGPRFRRASRGLGPRGPSAARRVRGPSQPRRPPRRAPHPPDLVPARPRGVLHGDLLAARRAAQRGQQALLRLAARQQPLVGPARAGQRARPRADAVLPAAGARAGRASRTPCAASRGCPRSAPPTVRPSPRRSAGRPSCSASSPTRPGCRSPTRSDAR